MAGSRRNPRRTRPQPYLFRPRHLTGPLLALAYFERAAAHVRLGWLARLESLETKTALGRHQHADMTVSVRLERAVWAATRLHPRGARSVPRSFRTFMRAVDRSPDERGLVGRLYLGVKAALLAAYEALIVAADPVLDANLLEALALGRAEAQRQVAWAEACLGRHERPGDQRAAVSRLLTGRSTGARLARKHWLWRPLARVPHCTRPAGLSSNPSGAPYAVLTDAPGTDGWAGEFFHHVAGSELATMEFYGRCSYEHPDLPEDFHQDYSRVTSDEARHAEIGLRYAARLGKPYGTLPINAGLYDFLYQYRPCQAGSKRELVWRLLLQGTLREGLILEGFSLQARTLRYDKLVEMADVVDKIAAEEIDHVAIALKWTRRLLGGDRDRVRAERDRAHAYYVAGLREARRQYVANDPDAAIAETEKRVAYADRWHKRFPFSSAVVVDRKAREAAGYTREEIDQVIRWGYVHP